MTNTDFITKEITHVMVVPEYGRAVFAMVDIPAIRLIESAEVLVLSDKDTPVVNSTDLRDYTFTFDDKRDCLVMGIGEMFNHSDTPNVSYELMNLNGRPKMMFFTTRAVNKGEQLFIDYNADLRPNEKKADYSTNLL